MRRALLALLLLCCTGLVAAQTPEQLATRGAEALHAGDWRAALGHFRAAADSASKLDQRTLAAHHYNNAARLHSRLGEFAQAESALNLASTVTEPRALTLLNRGDLALKRRRYGEAIEWLAQAERSAADEPLLQVQIHAVRGAVYRQQGDFEAALAAYARAAEQARELKQPALLALAERLAGESWLYRIEGQPAANRARAEQLLTSALAAHRRSGDQFSAAMAESHLGEHAWLGADVELAARRYRAALAVFEPLGYRDGVGRMRLHLGFASSDAGDQPAALKHFEAARNIYTALDDREWQRVAWFGIGQARERQGEPEAAEVAYFSALELFEWLRAGVAGGEPAQALFTLANRRLYERLVALLVKRRAIDQALQVVERSRLEQLAEYLLSGPQAAGSRDADRREGALGQLRRLGRQQAALTHAARLQSDDFERGRLAQQLASNEREASKLLRQLALRHRGLAATLDVIPNSRAFRDDPAFPEDLALLAYFVTDEALYLFLARKGRAVTALSIPVSAAELRDAVSSALVLIGEARSDQPRDAETKAALAQLHRWLIAPLSAQLAGVDKLALMPHRWLNFLPFAALYGPRRDGQPGWLLEDFSLQQLAAQSYAARLRELLGERQRGEISVLALGDPDLGDSQPALPFAAIEARHIGEVFPAPRSEVLLGARASKRNLHKYWGRYRVVHIAAHAQLGAEQAEILLAPAHSGVLQVDELFDWAPAEERTALLVLSACQTAVDPGLSQQLWRGASALQATPGPPLASAAHTLQLLGIPAVIATLWKVDDQASALLMRHYYSTLGTAAGRSAGYYAQLRAAQLRLAARDDRLARPYYWAAFQYFGMEP